MELDTRVTREWRRRCGEAGWLTGCFYSDNAIYDFSKKAVENGLDIFRVFDSLNYIGTSFVSQQSEPYSLIYLRPQRT